MWILFALTSAIILSSRKIQEKKLVGTGGQALGWMLRIGSVSAALLLWIFFSRSFQGWDSPIVWYTLLYCSLAYPLNVFLYLKAMHSLPLSTLGMLSPVVLIVSLLASWFVLDDTLSWVGMYGIMSVAIGIIALAWKHEEENIHFTSILCAIGSYSIMGFGYVLDRSALIYADKFLYTFANQFIALITLTILNYFFLKGLKTSFLKKNFWMIYIIGFTQWISYLFSMYAITHADNVAYATAIINTHAIITALYGVFILREKVTKRKIFVFICMTLALISFAFA